MASLQGLPTLPKSLKSLLNETSANWRETERIHAMRTMIQQDLNRSRENLGYPATQQDRNANSQHNNGSPRHHSNGLDGALATLRKEMVGLRQLDISLICQLWSLNESIQDYKTAIVDRQFSETNSECSQENGLETIHDTEELEAEIIEMEKESEEFSNRWRSNNIVSEENILNRSNSRVSYGHGGQCQEERVTYTSTTRTVQTSSRREYRGSELYWNEETGRIEGGQESLC